MLNQWEHLRLVIVTYWSHNSGFPTIASTVHHVKPMGASTAGDCNSSESPECIFPHEHFELSSRGTFPLESLRIRRECSTIWLLEGLTGGKFYQNSDLEPLAPHWVPEMSQGISNFCSAGGQGSELNNNPLSSL